MEDDGSLRYEIALARHLIDEMRQRGDVSKRTYETLSLGLDALARQDERARQTA